MGTSSEPARDIALRLLAVRDLTRRELRERLARKGCDPSDIDTVLDGLVRSTAVDDRRLAYNVILSRSRRMRLGRARLDAELRRRGVPEDDLAAAWEAVGAGYDGSVLLREALDACLRTGGPPRDRRAFDRLARQLARRGFPSGEILEALAPLRPGGRENDEARDDDQFRDS